MQKISEFAINFLDGVIIRMIKIIKALLKILILIPLWASAGISDDLRMMPIPLTDGKTVKLDNYRGVKPVYLKFWATWCQPCMKEMPHFQEAQEQYGNSIEIISINLGINDTMQDVREVISKFGLTMQTSFDESGNLAQAFRFVGSPYHLLLDKNLNLVHRGHKADEALDNKLALLSNEKPISELSSEVLNDTEEELVIPNLDKGITAILFTATWCDWYLKDTRPMASANCSRSQEAFNALVKSNPSINFELIVSRLWTSDADLIAYTKKYNIPVTGKIDVSNKMFIKQGVNTFPTLIVYKNGKEIYRTTKVQSNSLELSGL